MNENNKIINNKNQNKLNNKNKNKIIIKIIIKKTDWKCRLSTRYS